MPDRPAEPAMRHEPDDPLLWNEIVKRPLRGILREREPMSRHTSWRAGGPADRSYCPADLADLAVFLRGLPENEPVHFVGLGSNLLVRDGGLRGTVILLHGGLKQMRLIANEDDTGDAYIYAEAGIASPRLSRFAATHNFEGAEFLAGIPGTIGGALAMNAGCYGGETWQYVDRVLTIDRKGELRSRAASEYRVAYREVALKAVTGITDESGRDGPDADCDMENLRFSPLLPDPSDEWFVGAWFKFGRNDGEIARRKVKHLLLTRIATQPLSEPNAGSVFRNPPGSYAAQLIEDCGFKGARIGGAMVSPKHANFIVNSGNARADDIERLIEELRDNVLREFGILLKPEICIIGEKNNAT